MVVVNKWTDADAEAGNRANAALTFGGKLLCLTGIVEIVAADDDGSIYKMARLPANAIPVKCEIVNDAITGLTDIDLGLYEDDETTEADKDLFMDGEDINGGNALASPVDGLKTGPSIDEFGQKIWELLGKTIKNKKEGYVLALTANTVGSAAGTIAWKFWYILG